MTLTIGLCACSMAVAAPSMEVHGYVQNRVYLAPGANAEFRTERVSLSATAGLPNESTGYLEVYYHPWASASGLYLESAYFDTPAGDGRLRIGKGRRMTFGITPAYGNRRTSNYGIVGEAITQDRIQGIQYMLNKGNLEVGATVQTAYRLGTRAVGEIPGDTVRNATHSVPHLSFRDLPGELSNKLEFAGRVGGKWNNGLRAGASLSLSTLDNRDIANLSTSSAGNTLSPGGTPALVPGATSKTRNVWGLDAMYKMPSGFLVQGEFYDVKVSSLKYNAWDVLGGYEATNGWKYFVRYSQQNMDTPATANPLTWDQRQTSLSVVQPLNKGLWLQYEYEINDEEPLAGISKVKNNLFFVELFSGF